MRYLDYVIKFEKESGFKIDDNMFPEEKNNFHQKFAVWLVRLLERSDNSQYPNIKTPYTGKRCTKLR